MIHAVIVLTADTEREWQETCNDAVKESEKKGLCIVRKPNSVFVRNSNR